MAKLPADKRSSLEICIFTAELHGWSKSKTDTSAVTIAMAQHFAAQGDTVTLIWAPPHGDADDAPINKIKDYFYNFHLIKLEVLKSPQQIMPVLAGSEKTSAAIYYHLKERKFDVAVFPLEGGLAYYSVLAKELGLFNHGPTIVVSANAPIVWQAKADRHFLENLGQLMIAHMERYCVEHADKLVCSSDYILDWMKQEGWQVAKDVEVLPVLLPFEWRSRDRRERRAASSAVDELVFFSGPEFHKGLTLFCDTLDVLAKRGVALRTVTFLGRFDRILGEHTGGMIVRRSRRWPFDVKIMPRLTDQQTVDYLKGERRLAVVPRYMANTPLDIAICLEEGVPFITTDAGGITEMIDAKSREHCVSRIHPAAIAEKIVSFLASPLSLVSHIAGPEKRELWNTHLASLAKAAKSKKPVQKSTRKKPLVSIVMAHHDRPECLKEAVHAVEQQDYPNIELILVDDGSVLAESHRVLDDMEKRFEKRGWKILRQENKYLGAARNNGVRAARGERILFVDDDNALLKHAVTTFVDAMDASGADICTAFQRMFHGETVPTDENLGLIQYFPMGGGLDLGFVHDSFGDANAMIRRSVFDKIGFQVEDYGFTAQDWEFFARAVLAGLKLRIIPEPLYWYRSSPQGMYRSSHWYETRLLIMAAYRKHGFAGLEHLYHLVLSANVTHTERESYRENLHYNVSDERHLKLSHMDPESDEAIAFLAQVSAAEGRPDTAMILLGRSKSGDFRKRAGENLDLRHPVDKLLIEQGGDFSKDTVLDIHALKEFSLHSSDARDPPPLSYVEGEDRLYLKAREDHVSLAVKGACCPSGTVSVSASVSLDQAIVSPTEVLLLFLPEHADPLSAIRQATSEPGEGTSGWQELDLPFTPRRIEARLALPSPQPRSLVLAVRNRKGSSARASLGCFAKVTVSKSLAHKPDRRPRKGPPERELRAREWTNEERRSAKLLTDYPSELPLLLLPQTHAEGLFLRPSNAGNVIATLPWTFPPFARRVIGMVEIAHEEASPFEFAMALSRPDLPLQWKRDEPKDCLAFSGWLRAERVFELHQIAMEIKEIVRTPLSINLAIRLPSGSRASPSNAFWRKLILAWDE